MKKFFVLSILLLLSHNSFCNDPFFNTKRFLGCEKRTDAFNFVADWESQLQQNTPLTEDQRQNLRLAKQSMKDKDTELERFFDSVFKETFPSVEAEIAKK